MSHYYALIRDADGLELVVNSTRRELVRDFESGDYMAHVRGFIGPDDTVSIVKVDCTLAICQGCVGQNEDYIVEWGECDICDLPVSKDWPN